MAGIEIPTESAHQAYLRGKAESAAEIERLRAALVQVTEARMPGSARCIARAALTIQQTAPEKSS